jgi:hypothetical protein
VNLQTLAWQVGLTVCRRRLSQAIWQLEQWSELLVRFDSHPGDCELQSP